MLSHGNATWNLFTQMLEGCNSSDERTLIFAPLYHIGAQELPGLRVFGVGGLMVVMRRFDAKAVLESVDEHRITGMVMVSTMIHIMRDLPDRHKFDTSSLRWIVFGQVPENMLEEIQLIFPRASLKNSYGLTETCSTVTAIDPISQVKNPTSPGRVVSTLELDIVDDNDVSVSAREIGEIVVRGPKTMLGYWRQPEATAEAMKNGWLHTGDVGWRDESGLIFIVDRKKDMIRTGGENVASQEVERVIYEIEWVAEVAVVGSPDEKWGERIRAVIVPRPGMSGSVEAVLAHCRSHLATFKIPKDIEFWDELPRNPSGKVLKSEIRSKV
jgi:fatty-acyl-CoA synthase